jgi:nucleoside-diphosphate-sugar epimerase
MLSQISDSTCSRYEGCKVTVLGATGFIGRWVARALCKSKAQLTLVVRDAGAVAGIFEAYGISGEIVELDLQAQAEELGDLVRRIKPSVIFNLAAYGVERGQSDSSIAYAINKELVSILCTSLVGTQDPGWAGQQLVHVGSALEYGEIEGDLAEDSVPHPTTLYGQSKLEGTLNVTRICQAIGMRGVTARLFTVFGPGEHEGRLLPSLMEAAVTHNSLPLTDGRQLRDFTYVEDVAEGLLRIGVSECPAGSVLNLATGRLVSVREFAELAADELEMSSKQLDFGAIPTRAEEMAHGPVSNSKLQAAISWAPESDVRAGIRRTMEFLGTSPGQ